MKKISAVLLVLALVGGALFASFTGSADVEFGVNLDTGEYGFGNGIELNADLNFFELLVDNAGDGDVYAEIQAELTLGFDFEKTVNEYNPADIVYDDTDGDKWALDGMYGNVEITSAKIIGDNWYVGILGGLGAPNFAKTAIELNADTGAALLDLRDGSFKAPGVEVGFAGYSVGLGVKGNYADEEYTFLVSARTPEYEIADGVTAKAGAAVFLKDGDFKGAVSLAGGFAKDDLDISLAADLLMDKKAADELAFDAEVALAAAYDFLTADVYFATRSMDAYLQTSPYGTDENILSVKLGAEIEGFDITVKGLDLVNQQDLSASVGYAITDEISVAVRGGYIIDKDGPKEGTWSAGAGVKYTHDMFTAKLDADLVGTDEIGAVKLAASIASETLVDGATLSLGYLNNNLIGDSAEKGAITAKAVIEF